MPATAEQSATTAVATDSPATSGRWLDGVARVLLVAAWILCVLPGRPHVPPSLATQWDAENTIRGAIQLMVAEAGVATVYRLGLIGVVGISAWRGLPGDRHRRLIAPLRLIVLLALAAAAAAVRYPALAGPVLFVPAAVVATWGYTFGRALESGLGRVSRWAVSSVAVLAASGAAGLLTLTSSAAAVADMPAATAADRSRWQQMLRSAHDRNSGLAELRLTSNDLHRMVASWLTAHGSHVVADIETGRDDVQLRVSLPFQAPALGTRYLNVSAQFQPSVADAQLAPRFTRLMLGETLAPASLLKPANAIVRNALAADADLRRTLESIHSLRIDDGELLVALQLEQAVQAAADSFDVAPEAGDDLRERIRVYLRETAARGRTLEAGDARFMGLLRIVFDLARQRSTPQTAAQENRAALIALGIQIGDARVRRFAGFPADEPLPGFKRTYENGVTVRGRNDLARHFAVSAAVRALSSREWSFAIGLIKEQLDAAEGGSGLSFADLAADLAGVQFAQQATHRDSSALLLQSQLAEPYSVDDLMPTIDDLPEGLSQEAFREQYGSMTDPRFLKMTVEIRDRMAACRLLGVAAAEKSQ